MCQPRGASDFTTLSSQNLCWLFYIIKI